LIINSIVKNTENNLDYAGIDFFANQELIKSFIQKKNYAEYSAQDFSKKYKNERNRVSEEATSPFAVEIWVTNNGLMISNRLQDLGTYEKVAVIYQKVPPKLGLHLTDKDENQRIMIFSKDKDTITIEPETFNKYPEIKEYSLTADFQLIRFEEDRLIFEAVLEHRIEQDDIYYKEVKICDESLTGSHGPADAKLIIDPDSRFYYYNYNDGDAYLIGDELFQSSPDFTKYIEHDESETSRYYYDEAY
jgi:hypothetical protein